MTLRYTVRILDSYALLRERHFATQEAAARYVAVSEKAEPNVRGHVVDEETGDVIYVEEEGEA